MWNEVRSLNRQGMTIFLTTQYLEEADELADRVAIIARGAIAAEGTPAELKRSIGSDVIVVDVDGEAEIAADAVRSIGGVDHVDVHGDSLTVASADGAAVIAEVAVALNGCGVPVVSLTMRSPSLDDVFLDVTGSRLDAEGSPGGEHDDLGSAHDPVSTGASPGEVSR